MSVFTKVSYAELRVFLERYPFGELLGYQGIGEGVENTNYFVDTADGRWVMTLFERTPEEELPYFLALMDHLAARGFPCPAPARLHNGELLTELNGRPAAMVHRLAGNSVLFPSLEQCAGVGRALGEMHLAARNFPGHRANGRGAAWREETARLLLPMMDAATAALVSDELRAQARIDWSRLPQGVIHADLFRDNVLFVEERLSGVIDFYYACNDALLYDLAVAVNDWCSEPDGRPNPARLSALTDAYTAVRAPEPAEVELWPLVLRAAAMRFFLSRLHDWKFPREGDLVHIKDPKQYQRILEHHRNEAVPPL
jgi:homoserine kinase type II